MTHGLFDLQASVQQSVAAGSKHLHVITPGCRKCEERCKKGLVARCYGPHPALKAWAEGLFGGRP
jgi:hypothetical protein